MKFMDNRQKHLEFIQSIINRLAHNSFVLRGWAVTLVTGIFILSVARFSNGGTVVLSYVPFLALPLLFFWILDGYFLAQERCFRSLYDDVRKLDVKKIDFAMNVSSYKKRCDRTWLGSMFSKTVFLFYMFIALVAFLPKFIGIK